MEVKSKKKFAVMILTIIIMLMSASVVFAQDEGASTEKRLNLPSSLEGFSIQNESAGAEFGMIETAVISALSADVLAKFESSPVLAYITSIQKSGSVSAVAYPFSTLVKYDPNKKGDLETLATKLDGGANVEFWFYENIPGFVAVTADANKIVQFASNAAVEVVGKNEMLFTNENGLSDSNLGDDPQDLGFSDNYINGTYSGNDDLVEIDGAVEGEEGQILPNFDTEYDDISKLPPLDPTNLSPNYEQLGDNVQDITHVNYIHSFGYLGQGKYIAVLDTGLNASHPMFSGRVARQACFSTNVLLGSNSLVYEYARATCGGGAASSNSAFPDYKYWANRPNSWWEPDEYTEVENEFSHGSHVTGIAAGKTGIAQQSAIIHVNVFSLREIVLRNGGRHYPNIYSDGVATVFWNDLLKGLDYVLSLAKSGLNIAAVNMSLGGGQYNSVCNNIATIAQAMTSAFNQLRNYGVIPVVSAGNDWNNDAVSFPACISNAYTVGAMQTRTQKASFSNYHYSMVDVMAPGVNLYSAYLPITKMGYMSGTSMAAPVVTGLFGLLKGQSDLANTVGKLEVYLKGVTPNFYGSGSTAVVDMMHVVRPSSMTAYSGVSGRIRLTWKRVIGADAYRIYIGSSRYNLSPVGNTTGTTFNIDGLLNGWTYFVAVRPYRMYNGIAFLSPTQITNYMVPSTNFSERTVTGSVNEALMDNKQMLADQNNIGTSDASASGAAGTSGMLPGTGFRPKILTLLKPQAKPYALAYAGVRLRIPTIYVDTDILGVPYEEGKYDISWLNNSAGWLTDSAFPGRLEAGNSVIIGHVVNSLGKPGPFISLENLGYGDSIIVEAFGERYTYKVKEVSIVLADTPDVIYPDKDESVLTLLTCKYFNEATGAYNGRVVVRAVLDSISVV